MNISSKCARVQSYQLTIWGKYACVLQIFSNQNGDINTASHNNRANGNTSQLFKMALPETFLSILPPLRAGVQLWPRPACGLSFSRSQLDSRVFLRAILFSSLIKIDSQLITIWLWWCALTSNMDCTAATRGAFECFQPDLMSCALSKDCKKRVLALPVFIIEPRNLTTKPNHLLTSTYRSTVPPCLLSW